MLIGYFKYDQYAAKECMEHCTQTPTHATYAYQVIKYIYHLLTTGLS